MKKMNILRICLIAVYLSMGMNIAFSQTTRDLQLTGGPNGDYSGYEKAGLFNLTFTNVSGTSPATPTPLPAGSLQIVLAIPPGMEFDDAYTPPTGWTFEKSGPQTVVLRQTAAVSSSPPASIVSFAVPLTTKSAVDEGVWSAQIQRVLPTYQDNNPNNSFPNGTVSVADVNLPVALTQFLVVKESNAANLAWSTTEETNSDHFEVQHSLNAKNWAVLGTVKSHGESKVLRNYNYQHATPNNGANYYRLRMVDNDETFAYSTIRSVNFAGLAESAISVFPNPASDHLFVNNAEINKLKTLTIVAQNGKELVSSPVSATGVSIKSLQPGLYLVKLLSQDGTLSTHKLIISK